MSNADDNVRHQTALLLDLENLVIPFEKKKGTSPAEVEIDPIVEFLEDNFGDVIFRRAYADWSNKAFSAVERELQDLGVEMIHVRRRSARSKKNGADILLTADAVESLLLRPYIQVFGIVSGDSDIGPLITKLRSHGKTVVVIGPDKKSTARHVIELADRFKYYSDVVGGGSSPSEPPRSRPRSPKRAVVRLLREAGGSVESAMLKRQLLDTPGFSNFSEKALGFKSWTDFLHSIDGVEVIRQSDLGIEIRLDKKKR